MGSIQTVQDVLAEFEVLSGLKANPAKSAFFGAEIHRDDKLASFLRGPADASGFFAG
jgi:hypothetical protein